MSDVKALTCPTCGAQLNVSGDEAQVKCSYCGNNVIVPAELRTRPPEVLRVDMPQVVVVQQPQPLPRSSVGYFNPPRSRAGSPAFGCLFTLGLLAVVAGIIYVSVPPEAWQFFSGIFQRATGTGFARQVASFGAEGTGPGLFQDAWHVAADGNGSVYVSDHNSLRIQRFDTNGKFLGLWTIEEKGKRSTQNGPDRLAAGRDGSVYALWTGVVLKYEGATGKLLGKFTGDVVNNVANLSEDIQDMALLPNGNVLAITSASTVCSTLPSPTTTCTSSRTRTKSISSR